jgi:hypothetical protein
MVTSDRERAKRIIAEIVRQAGGTLDNRTNLYKAFYHAHLLFAEKNAGYLSEWQIVRMPRGPGIHRGIELLNELVASGTISVEYVPRGRTFGFKFNLVDDRFDSGLSRSEIEAIARAVRLVKEETAAAVSHKSHETSRSWNSSNKRGESLNIYDDLLSEVEYATKLEKMGKMIDAFNDL